jgi:hypothetical protein
MEHEDIERRWQAELKGKELIGLKTIHPAGPVPHVQVWLKGGGLYVIKPGENVYFQGCMINTLRKPQPIDLVQIAQEGRDFYVEVWSETFPLFSLIGVQRGDIAEFPFALTRETSLVTSNG